MRILMLAQFYPPVVGGEERHVQGLSRELVTRGHDVSVATLALPGEPEFEIDARVRIHRIRTTMQRATWAFTDSARPHVPPFPDPEASAALHRIITKERPEIVHAHNWLVHSFLPLKAWSGAKLVMTLHDYSLACAKKRLMYRGAPCSGPGLTKCLGCASDHYGAVKGVTTTVTNWVMGAVERHAVDMFIAVSHATAVGNGIIDRNLPCRIIPNFVPDDLGKERTGDDPRLAQLPGEEYLLYVGDLSQDKGVDVLLRAYSGLSGAPPLVLIGRQGPDAPQRFPDNVVVLGPWPNDVVMESRYRSLLALAPSVWDEPFGIVVLESMAAGRPVIASNIGGLPDIVDNGVTGLLVPPGNAEALAHAMASLLADGTLRETMGSASRERVNLFRASVVVPRIEAVYQEVTGASTKMDTVATSAGMASHV
ncbi:MAG: glycosyltransferase family 4 protein [Chloroflexota bacterium]